MLLAKKINTLLECLCFGGFERGSERENGGYLKVLAVSNFSYLL